MTRQPVVHWNDKWKDEWIDGSETKQSRSPNARDFLRTSRPSPFTAPKTPPPVISDDDVEYIQADDLSPRQSTSNNDLPPTVICYPSSSKSSLETYTSSQSSETDSTTTPPLGDDADKSPHDGGIPPSFPSYRRRASLANPTIRSSDPRAFSTLFPSMDRLSIRHDDRSVDGNLNLRVETTAMTTIQSFGMKKRPVTVQLFHLAMHGLAQRDFSLLRYGPDSGREVCSSKRTTSVSRSGPAMQQIYSALKSPFLRPRAESCPSHEQYQPRINEQRAPVSSTQFPEPENARRLSIPGPNTSTHEKTKPSSTIRLEFSNYATVTLHKSSKKYAFDWWGHRYTWRRETSKTLSGTSFHLIRDGDTAAPVAHIVPEVQSAIEAQAERAAGGWVPPCFMWICDEGVIEALTDVADVIVASGLIALVDDSIRRHWQVKKLKSRRASVASIGTDTQMNNSGPGRMFMSRMFPRRQSMQQPNSPLRTARLAST